MVPEPGDISIVRCHECERLKAEYARWERIRAETLALASDWNGSSTGSMSLKVIADEAYIDREIVRTEIERHGHFHSKVN